MRIKNLDEAKKKKRKKKGSFGWFDSLNPNAGDVEKNNEIFNQGFSSDGGSMGMSVGEALNKLNEEDVTIEEGLKGQTSLKLALVELTKQFFPNSLEDDTKYVVHHYDGDHDSNRFENLCLMKQGEHSSLHGKLRHCNSEEERQAVLAQFENKIIRIGKLFVELLNTDIPDGEQV